MQPKRRTSKLTASYIKKLRREHEQAETRVATAKKRLGEFNFLIRNERRFMKEIQEKLKVLDEELKRKQTETVNKEITDKQMKCSICDQSYRGFTKSAPMILGEFHLVFCFHEVFHSMRTQFVQRLHAQNQGGHA